MSEEILKDILDELESQSRDMKEQIDIMNTNNEELINQNSELKVANSILVIIMMLIFMRWGWRKWIA